MSGVEFVDIPFGAYLPDLGGAPNPDMPGYLVDALGVRPTANGYRGAPVFASLPNTTAVGVPALFGGTFFKSSGGDNIFFVGDADSSPKIWESVDYGVNWTNVTPAAGHSAPWYSDYFSFGTDCIVVGPAGNVPFKRSLAHASIGTAFTNLGGSPPASACGTRVRQHVVLGGLASNPCSVQWSEIGNHESWPTPGSTDALAKQAGSQVFSEDYGTIGAIVGGDKIGIIFHEKALTRMTYEGGDTVFSFDTYATGVGFGSQAYSTKIASDGLQWYWYNENGFFSTDGYTVSRLDDGTIREAIFNRLLSHPSQSGLSTTGRPVYDSHRDILIFGGISANPTLCYHVRSKSFFWLNDSNVVLPFEGFKSTGTGITAGTSIFAIDASTRKLEWLSGDGAGVAIQTGYIEIDPGYEVQLEGAHLLGTGVPGSLTIAYKAATSLSSANLSQAGFTSMVAQSRGMKSAARATAQFFSFRITGTGSEAQLLRGLRIYFSRAQPSP